MGARASVALCNDPSSVRIVRPSAKVSPELVAPSPVLEPEVAARCVFGVALETLREEGQMVCGVPLALRDMVQFLDRRGMQHRGLFRLCSSVIRTRQLRRLWDHGGGVDLERDGDVPTVASLLKLFLRELPTPTVPEAQRQQLIRSLSGYADEAEVNQSLRENLHHLPADNLILLSYLIHFLSRVAAHSQSNHMPMENLATIFGPCIFHADTLTQGCGSGSDVSADIQKLIPDQEALEEKGEGTEVGCVPPCPTDPGPEQHPHQMGPFQTVQEKPPESTTKDLLCCIYKTEDKTEEPGWKNPSLKLRALEADLGPPPAPVDPQVQDNLPAQQQPLSTEEQSLYLTHKPFLHSPPSLPAQDNNTIDFFPPVESPSPPPSASSPVLSTATLSEDKSGDESSSSPTDTNTSPLLSCFTTSDCPVPSPRCPNLSHSLRYNLDPDTAPSPPCSQHIRMARCSIHTEPGEGSASIAVLNRHIHTLRKRIRHFEERFEQEKHYKPAHNDKTADPEVARLMKELIKSRKQLKELKLRQSEDAGLRGQGGLNPPVKTRRTNKDQREAALTGTDLRQCNNNSNSKPNVEETLNTITNRLKERRRELGVPDSIKEMSHYHMTLEKTSMQKCLLYFESLHGRPSTKQERTLMEPLYDRYRVLKQLLFFSAASTVITTIEEEEGSDEGHPNQRSPGQQPLWLKPPRCVSPEESLHLPSLETSETPLVSPLEEGKGLQLPLITMATLHEASRPELLDHLRMARLEKRRLHQALREFEDHFYMQTGRACQKEDRGPMAEEYCQYKKLKAKLRLLEALLSKQQASTRTS
ncbi:hypothetical protein F2P81_019781 [Scophthalmus maximus]|uniref:Rho-GAP domain-containing protein n=1 Tax=Scophthalmus maximus TaxID=52904 RepID=A0A6A4S684_SCOMX|nr:hypothetical protein F2P81_019781 [Scophthalmus maximus]